MKMYEETSYFCPLVNREMWDSECYDVQMVHYKFIDGAEVHGKNET